jgi:hypothetical protein
LFVHELERQSRFVRVWYERNAWYGHQIVDSVSWYHLCINDIWAQIFYNQSGSITKSHSPIKVPQQYDWDPPFQFQNMRRKAWNS